MDLQIKKEDNREKNCTIGMLARGIFDSRFMDSLIMGINKSVKVKTESTQFSIYKWRKLYYDRKITTEINWGFFNSPLYPNIYFERLDIWEKEKIVRTIVLARNVEIDSIVAISDFLF